MTQLRSTRESETGGSGTPLGLSALLAGTLVGTVSLNVVNVPLSAICADFQAPLAAGVFVAVGFLVAFAATVPLAGWLGDRFGRRRVYCAALLATAVCAVGAATAPTLAVLIVWRSVGGAAAAAFAPAVMGLIALMFTGQRRARAVGAWAAANGIGQAVGPSLGGLVADAWGWRWIFVPLVPIALVAYGGTLRYVPRFAGRPMSFDLSGAAALTVGAALLMVSVSLLPQPELSLWVPAGTAVAATVLLVWWGWHCARVAEPFVAIRQVAESRFLRSALASFAQMFCLGATLLAVPLYLVAGSSSIAEAGLVLFTVPATMTVLAPLVGRWLDGLGARRVMRSGLILLALAQVALALVVTSADAPRVALLAVLVGTGVGIALVQTPATTGATRSPIGASGTGLGLYNLIRFGGSAMGAAWVAVGLHFGSFSVVFAGAAVVVAAGFAASFAGADPQPA